MGPGRGIRAEATRPRYGARHRGWGKVTGEISGEVTGEASGLGSGIG